MAARIGRGKAVLEAISAVLRIHASAMDDGCWQLQALSHDNTTRGYSGIYDATGGPVSMSSPARLKLSEFYLFYQISVPLSFGQQSSENQFIPYKGQESMRKNIVL